jgi:hypothetical protein
MKFFALMFFFLPMAFAEGTDPFDPASCDGPRISAKRVLELMGPNYIVNLAKNEPNNMAELVSRYRFKLEGEVGEWQYGGAKRDLTPYLGIQDGKLALQFAVVIAVRGGGTSKTTVSCELDSAGFVKCMDTSNQSWWGNRVFSGKLTDSCLSLSASIESPSNDKEFAYLLKF